MITITELTKDNLEELYVQLRTSPGYLNQLRWSATSQYDQFQQQFLQLMKLPDILIFVVWQDNQIAGSIEIKIKSDSYLMGYWLGAQFQGQGIMTLAIQDLLNNKLKDKRMVIAEVSADNKKSCSVLVRTGFVEFYRDRTRIGYKRSI